MLPLNNSVIYVQKSVTLLKYFFSDLCLKIFCFLDLLWEKWQNSMQVIVKICSAWADGEMLQCSKVLSSLMSKLTGHFCMVESCTVDNSRCDVLKTEDYPLYYLQNLFLNKKKRNCGFFFFFRLFFCRCLNLFWIVDQRWIRGGGEGKIFS